MAHRKARLNVLGRELLVTRVTVMGWPVATAAEAQGISRATGYKWVRRFRAEGAAGLADRSSRPHRSPRATPAVEVARAGLASCPVAAARAGRRRIGTRGTELLRAAQAWRRTHEWPADMGTFGREILPGLADLPSATIAQATGSSPDELV